MDLYSCTDGLDDQGDQAQARLWKMFKKQNRSASAFKRQALTLALGTILLAAGLPTLVAAESKDRPDIAMGDFSFRDTSGEVRDQTAEHEKRLSAFNDRLHGALAKAQSADFTILDCRHNACDGQRPSAKILSAEARDKQLHLMLVGEIHKMSTLVGWVNLAVIDLKSNKPVCDRFLTYRGDTDEAWQRAAATSAHIIIDECVPKIQSN